MSRGIAVQRVHLDYLDDLECTGGMVETQGLLESLDGMGCTGGDYS